MTATTTPASVFQQRRYMILFFALLATIAIGPLLQAMPLGRATMEALVVVSLLAAVFPIVATMQRRMLYALVVVAVLMRAWSSQIDAPAFIVAGALIWCLVAAWAAFRAVRHSMSSVKVSSERMYAALSAYLLVGVCWGVLYAALARAVPGAFYVFGAPAEHAISMAEAIYFSFVTLATLGYGDITPGTAPLRGLAVFEAIFGQLYLAILVARLVGLHTAEHTR
ncbi:potassium channel family protein [Lysobacter panacisoli]|uniref:Potassium channel family protein n=1 Tax=Lysobacter panacisoli TaxID=1255263 RepID=A0ABP9LDR7_9GAMM|nr:potassium channel family protein [Lysobacter panacisoli]